MRRRKPLPERDLAQVVEAFPSLRQTLLAKFDDCMLSSLFDLEGGGRWSNDAQARGTIFHRVAGEILRTLQRTGQVRMPVAEGLEILYEQMAQRGVPDEDVVLPSARERRMLRILVIKFCAENEFGMRRLLAVERRLSTTVTYPHPVTGEPVERVISGQPDAILGDPATAADPWVGYVCLDWKTTRKALPQRKPDADSHDDAEHLSHLGYFQQRSYGLLIFRNYPLAERVQLREFYPLEKEVRESELWRDRDLEYLEREFSALVELFDRAVAGGSKGKVWKPSEGLHCRYCRNPVRCPIDADERIRNGGITSHAEARRAAAQAVKSKEIYDAIRPSLKAWYQEHGDIPVRHPKGRYAWRERQNSTGNGKQFGCFPVVPEDGLPPDPQLEEAFAEVAERVRSAA